jgi:hypothetical protein
MSEPVNVHESPKPAKPEPKTNRKKLLFNRDEQDIQDKNKLVFRLNPKPFILFILPARCNVSARKPVHPC